MKETLESSAMSRQKQLHDLSSVAMYQLLSCTQKAHVDDPFLAIVQGSFFHLDSFSIRLKSNVVGPRWMHIFD